MLYFQHFYPDGNEHTCTENQFRCITGDCVPLSWVCDNEIDCTDASDEDYEGKKTSTKCGTKIV